MSLTGKERAVLRAQAHHLKPIVQVGRYGITAALSQAFDEALTVRKLVKLSVSRTAGVSAREAASRLAAQLGAEVVQVIGRTATLYRARSDQEVR